MRAGSRSACEVWTDAAAAAAAVRRADELRASERANVSEANGIFCHLASSPGLPFLLLFLHGGVFAAAAEGLNKPGKIIKILPNDETLAAKRP